MKCPKCESAMELGFVGDQSYGQSFGQLWYSGPMKWWWWGPIKLNNRKKLFVQTMRCRACGFLESYAADER
jgi:hypothetical protein